LKIFFGDSGIGKKSGASFADRWTGKLRLRMPAEPAPRFEALKKKYRLD